MGHLFGVPPEIGPSFRRWTDGILKDGLSDLDIARVAARETQEFFASQLRARSDAGDEAPDDLISTVLNAEAEEPDGTIRPFSERERIGALFTLMLGGIDTTWSSLGTMLLHLGTHPEDRDRLVDEPALIPSAVEEFLRFYSPVTIARYINSDAEVGGCPVSRGPSAAVVVPVGESRSRLLRSTGRVDPRPREQPPYGLRRRRASLHGFELGSHGVARGSPHLAGPVPPI